MERHMFLIAVTVGALLTLITAHSLQLKWEEELKQAKQVSFSNGLKTAVQMSVMDAIITVPTPEGVVESIYCTDHGRYNVMLVAYRNNMTVLSEKKISEDCVLISLYDADYDNKRK